MNYISNINRLTMIIIKKECSSSNNDSSFYSIFPREIYQSITSTALL